MQILRRVTHADLADLMHLSTTVNWNQTEADWLRLLELEPEGCFGMEQEDRVVASATVITYGRTLAWIGMVLTLPEARGRGHATRLMQECLDYCDRRGVAAIKLDATDLGRPVYEKFGFQEEYVVERWKGTLPALDKVDFPIDLELDRQAFGADRSALLKLTGSSRAGRVAAYVGPVVARSKDQARERILYAGASGPAYWDLPMPNENAVALAGELGFEPFRKLWRMRRGAPMEERPDLVYALAGFEVG